MDTPNLTVLVATVRSSAGPSTPSTGRRAASMEHAVGRLAVVYHDTISKYLDPRSEGWLLCWSPLVPFSIIFSYLYFVKKCGPDFMAHRRPYDVKNVMIVYNVVQILANAYIFIVGGYMWLSELHSWSCQPVDYRVTDATVLMASLVHFYYVLKIADLIDTVFFVLRKKGSQATFLHVYHHCTMVFAGYIACRFTLNGHVFLLGVINALVHSVLYSYYLLAAVRPATTQASWKKYITILQLTQFAILVVHNALPLLQPDCKVQKFWSAVLVVQNVFMFVMFSDFYVKAYSSKSKKTA